MAGELICRGSGHVSSSRGRCRWVVRFCEEERHLLKTFEGCSSRLRTRAWLLQRQ
jgi:hypothetical protein